MPEPHQPSPQGPSDDTSVDPAAPADVAPAPDTEELLRRADLKAQEHHDAWLRAKAEAENIRKRTAIELTNAYKYAVEAIAADLLPVKDSLEATLAAESAALETLSAALIVLPETRIWGLALGAMVLIAAVSTVTWHREYKHLPPGVALAALTGIELAIVLRGG